MSDDLVIKMLNWYLVQLKPNGHRLAKANLERQGFKTFLPLQNVTKRSAHKFVDRRVPLFPGYMFVKLDIAQNDWRKVNSTLGVAFCDFAPDRTCVLKYSLWVIVHKVSFQTP